MPTWWPYADFGLAVGVHTAFFVFRWFPKLKAKGYPWSTRLPPYLIVILGSWVSSFRDGFHILGLAVTLFGFGLVIWLLTDDNGGGRRKRKEKKDKDPSLLERWTGVPVPVSVQRCT